MVDTRPVPGRRVAVQCAAALAASVGVGRFAFTPILPMMVAQAGLTSQDAALLASVNYVGYFIGALTGILSPAVLSSRRVVRASLVLLVLTIAGMPVGDDMRVWMLLRLIAGIVSAIVFMAAVSVALGTYRGPAGHIAGWAFGGIGVGIALSGALVLALRETSTWSVAWWSAAAAAAVFTGAGWNLPAAGQRDRVHVPHARRPAWRFWAVFASYSLEGAGYIIAGTFLVVAIGQSSPAWIANGSWVIVGLAAIPSAAVLSLAGRRWSLSTLLLLSLALQAVGVALPGLWGGWIPGAIAAILFGATIVGIGTLSLGIGVHLGFPRAVSLLTAGYAAGQFLGPLLVAPALSHGFQSALLIAATVIGIAALAAGTLAFGRPRRVD